MYQHRTFVGTPAQLDEVVEIERLNSKRVRVKRQRILDAGGQRGYQLKISPKRKA